MEDGETKKYHPSRVIQDFVFMSRKRCCIWCISLQVYNNCPGNSFTCPVVDRTQLRSNGHQRVHTGYLQEAERMRTGQTAREPGKPHTNCHGTHSPHCEWTRNACKRT